MQKMILDLDFTSKEANIGLKNSSWLPPEGGVKKYDQNSKKYEKIAEKIKIFEKKSLRLQRRLKIIENGSTKIRLSSPRPGYRLKNWKKGQKKSQKIAKIALKIAYFIL